MIRKMMAGALRHVADAVAPDETDWNGIAQWAVGLAAILGLEVGAIYLKRHHDKIAELDRCRKDMATSLLLYSGMMPDLATRLDALEAWRKAVAS